MAAFSNFSSIISSIPSFRGKMDENSEKEAILKTLSRKIELYQTANMAFFTILEN